MERVICPGRQIIVDLGCGPGAVTKLILERLGDARDVRVIGIDPSPSAIERARAAIKCWRRWIVRAVQALRERGLDVHHTEKATARDFLSPEQYSALCVAAGFAPPAIELVKVNFTFESMVDIARFSLFIEGALPGVPLEEGARALEIGLVRTMNELGVSTVPRFWMEAVATAA